MAGCPVPRWSVSDGMVSRAAVVWCPMAGCPVPQWSVPDGDSVPRCALGMPFRL
ncbi:hypothetical protein JZM24_07130 [Candidatus Sodalis endolongispinus]|uniref:Uncharacterized protein n=1 Tax=Candidatus Sodalis endolongispinus TaxID=2812662 RepID=A0ABS5YAD2_9GAMM|nr:hypothetical protein [Candidatus Sodalis endolongispinus]MBT9431965.1 hypothetical protein [Candidatus Sodalis endolongispinus]